MANQSLLERLRQAQMKDVVEMQEIIDAAQSTDPDKACKQVLGGEGYNLSKLVAEGIKHEGRNKRMIMRSPLLKGRKAILEYLQQMRSGVNHG